MNAVQSVHFLFGKTKPLSCERDIQLVLCGPKGRIRKCRTLIEKLCFSSSGCPKIDLPTCEVRSPPAETGRSLKMQRVECFSVLRPDHPSSKSGSATYYLGGFGGKSLNLAVPGSVSTKWECFL